MPGGSRHAPKPRGSAEGGRSSQTVPGGRSAQTPPRRTEVGSSVDEDRIADVIRPVVAAAGMDLESVRVTAAGRRRLLCVVVDSDRGVSLDDAAAVSRELSTALDTVAVMGDFPYTLEVSSPGVDRPLTDHRPDNTRDPVLIDRTAGFGPAWRGLGGSEGGPGLRPVASPLASPVAGGSGGSSPRGSTTRLRRVTRTTRHHDLLVHDLRD